MALKTTTVWYNPGFSHFTKNFRLSWKHQTQCLAPYSALFLFRLLKHHSPSGHEEWGMRSWCEFQFVLTCPSWCSLPPFTPISSPQLPAWLTAASSFTRADGSLPVVSPVPTSYVCAQLSQKSLTYHSEWFCLFSGIRTLSSWFCLLFNHPFLHQRVKVSSLIFCPCLMFPLHFSSLSLSLPVIPFRIVQSPSSNSLLTWSSKLPF